MPDQHLIGSIPVFAKPAPIHKIPIDLLGIKEYTHKGRRETIDAT
jgi:hypothetical protein